MPWETLTRYSELDPSIGQRAHTARELIADCQGVGLHCSSLTQLMIGAGRRNDACLSSRLLLAAGLANGQKRIRERSGLKVARPSSCEYRAESVSRARRVPNQGSESGERSNPGVGKDGIGNSIGGFTRWTPIPAKDVDPVLLERRAKGLCKPPRLRLPRPPVLEDATEPAEDTRRARRLRVLQPGHVPPSAHVRDGEGLRAPEYRI